MLLTNIFLPVIYISCAHAVFNMNAFDDGESTLELVHVLFRHGQRTPDPSTIYPNDPHINETYFPFGVGMLTKEGKRTQYNLGRELRKRYNDFLGYIYTPDTLDVQVSPVRRTRISAQLVLASLFAPSNIEKWNAHLDWQPVDFEYAPRDEDLLFLYLANCQRYVEAVKQRNFEGFTNGELKKYEKFFDYLAKHSGWNITSLEEVFLLNNGLSTEQELGLALPMWTEKIFPEPLRSVSKLFWKYSADSDLLKTLSGGFILKRIAEDTMNKIQGAKSLEKRKMVLYSGHDYTIVGLLSALGVFEPHHPIYGSYVIIEVHRTSDGHAVQVFYKDSPSGSPRLLQLPKCEVLCRFDDFLNLYSKYFPTPDMCKLD